MPPQHREAIAAMERLACRRPELPELAALRAKLGDRGVVRHVVLEGVPFVFRAEWHVWEKIRDVVTRRLGAAPAYTRVTGSANRGYSFRDSRPFDPARSDLDLLLIDRGLFDKLEAAAYRAMDAKERGDKWAQNWPREVIERTQLHLSRGFVQTSRLAPRTPELGKFSRCIADIERVLQQHSAVKAVKAISFRVYRDEAAAHRQLARGLVPAKPK